MHLCIFKHKYIAGDYHFTIVGEKLFEKFVDFLFVVLMIKKAGRVDHASSVMFTSLGRGFSSQACRNTLPLAYVQRSDKCL